MKQLFIKQPSQSEQCKQPRWTWIGSVHALVCLGLIFHFLVSFWSGWVRLFVLKKREISEYNYFDCNQMVTLTHLWIFYSF